MKNLLTLDIFNPPLFSNLQKLRVYQKKTYLCVEFIHNYVVDCVYGRDWWGRSHPSPGCQVACVVSCLTHK